MHMKPYDVICSYFRSQERGGFQISLRPFEAIVTLLCKIILVGCQMKQLIRSGTIT